MGKIVFLILSILVNTSFLSPKDLLAQSTPNCQITQDPPTLTQNLPPLSTTVPEDQRWFKFRIVVTDRTAKYKVVFQEGRLGFPAVERGDLNPGADDGVLRQSNNDLPGLQYKQGATLFTPTTHNFYIERQGASGHYCDGSYTIQPDLSGGIQTCDLRFTPTNPNENQEVSFSGMILPQGNYGFVITGRTLQRITVDSNGVITSFNLGRLNPGTYQLTIQKQQYVLGTNQPTYISTNCRYTLQIAPAGGSGSTSPVGSPGPGGTGTGPAGSPAAAGGEPCDSGKGFKTAIGCVRTSPAELVKDVMTFVVAISGGFAFLMMLLGAFQMLTSAGNPETLATGKDRFTSAIIGLLVVIFAVLLLQIIGFDILRLPDFGR